MLFINWLLLANLNGFMVTMFIYATCKLRVLQHKLQHSQSYIGGSSCFQIHGPRFAQNRFINDCVQDHLSIIR